MIRFARAHFTRHARFYLAGLLGLVVWSASGTLVRPLRLAMAADTFFGAYLILTAALVARATPDILRKRAAIEDEGIILIVFIALAAVCFSLAAIFSLLDQQQRPGLLQLLLGLASAPLGWLTLHTIAAFHYAHVYYGKTGSNGSSRDTGGLKFPATEYPHAWDFVYYSFVIGMTAQVSDVITLSTTMRKLTLAHAVVSFFYNTVLLALAVNVAVVLGQ